MLPGGASWPSGTVMGEDTPHPDDFQSYDATTG